MKTKPYTLKQTTEENTYQIPSIHKGHYRRMQNNNQGM